MCAGGQGRRRGAKMYQKWAPSAKILTTPPFAPGAKFPRYATEND